MSKLLYDGETQYITYTDNNGESFSYECRNAYEGGYNSEGQPRESLPNGVYYGVWAEDLSTAMSNGISYGKGYIHTTDYRGRDIHGGSSCADPYASYQGWRCTYGCLRMQNADVMELSQRIIDDGNSAVLTVTNNENAEEL